MIDNINDVLYSWLAAVLIFSLIIAFVTRTQMKTLNSSIEEITEKLRNWKLALVLSPLKRVNIKRLSVYFQELRYAILKITVVIFFILLPLYSVLKIYSSSYELEYAWTISALLISGKVATLCLFFAFVFFILVCRIAIKKISERINDQIPKTGDGSHAKDSISTRSSESAGNQSEKFSFDSNPIAQLVIRKGPSILSNDTRRILLGYTLISLFNVLFMCATDFSYVYIVLNYSSVFGALAAFVLALFRLYTNNVLLWNALPIVADLIRSSKDGGSLHRKLAEKRIPPTVLYTARDISFLENLILFNNIIIPVLAVFVILPDCFYNALFAASNVTSSYNYKTCFQFFVVESVGHSCTIQTQEISYSPPYLYSYQCSSKIVINYVAVYVIMFLLVGIVIPVGQILTKLYYDRYFDQSTSHFLKTLQSLILPEYLLHYHFFEENVVESEILARSTIFTKKRKRLLPTIVVFNKIQFVVHINSYITIIITFGTLFPPLALIGCFTIYTKTLFEEICLGRLLYETRQLGKEFQWYEEQIEKECEDVEKSSNFTLWSTLFVSSGLYGYIVFDTMGDETGWQLALPMTLILVFWPLMMLILENLLKYCFPKYYRQQGNCKADDVVDIESYASASSIISLSRGSFSFPEKNSNRNTFQQESRLSEVQLITTKDSKNHNNLIQNPLHDNSLN